MQVSLGIRKIKSKSEYNEHVHDTQVSTDRTNKPHEMAKQDVH